MTRGILRAFADFSDRQARAALLAAGLSLGVAVSAGWAAENETGAGIGGRGESSSHAASSEARAERYVEAVSAYLERFSGRLLGGVSMTGPVTAADLGDAVEVLFPDVAIAGGRIRLGDVAARVRPLEGPRYDVDISWGGHAGIYENDAGTDAVDVADPRLEGRWDSELEAFVEFDVETGSVVWTKGDERVVTAEAMSVNHRLLPDGKGRWDEDSIIRVSGLGIGGREGNARIGDVGIGFRRMGLNPAEWLFLDAFARPRTAGKLDETLVASAREPETVGEGHVEMRFTDIEVGSETKFALGNLVLRVDYKETSGNLSVEMTSPRASMMPSHYLPESVAVDAEILGFSPKEAFVALSGRPAWGAGEGFSELRRALLSGAGRAEIRVSEFKVKFPPAEANAHGTLRLDGSGGLVGEIRARMTGVDGFLAALPKAALREAMVPVALLKGLGRPVVGSDGSVAYAYEIGLSSGGAITVNGMPWTLNMQRR